jgi:phosphatidylglycerol:prolipoprotein diacylglycerol transferase
VYPRFLQFGSLVLPTDAVLIAVGILAGLALSMTLARRAGLDPEKVWNLGLIAVIAAIVGSRLLVILENWQAFRAAPLLLLRISAVHPGAFFGGIALACAAALVYARHAHLPLLRTLDVAAPALALAHAMASLGSFAAGRAYGRPTSLPWGVTFTSRFAARTTGVPLGTPLHPTQLYASAAGFALLGVLLVLLKRPHHEGEIMGASLFLFGITQFFIEFLRGDATRPTLFAAALTSTQCLAIIMVLLGGLLWVRPHGPEKPGKEVTLAG